MDKNHKMTLNNIEKQKIDKKFNHDLLKFVAGLGKALSSAGISVTAIQSILYDITRAYGVNAEILFFTTFLIIKLGDEESSPLATVNKISGLSHLNQVSELYELIYLAEKAKISPEEGEKRLKEIMCQKHRFGVFGIIIGYILFALGLGMLLQPTPQQLIVSGFLGGIVSLLLILSENRVRLTLILPVISAFVVSTIFFWG
ncbi:MAG: threonine/serine exporter family protein, partial [Methanobacteriaceae archaeon]|nr:threonine/serine exporter family protein [Methanobacteriaceae archaeon]